MPSSQSGAAWRAVEKSPRLPNSTPASTAATAAAPITLSAVRQRRMEEPSATEIRFAARDV
jgi:hypothetical protein